MNVIFISFAVALLLALGLVFSLGGLSLLSGVMDFLFGKPSLSFLKSKHKEGFCFGLKFNNEKEPARFDQVQIRLFNPFGSPTQVDITRDFDSQNNSFAKDLDIGPSIKKLVAAQGVNDALVTVTVSSSKDGISYPFNIKANKFLSQLENAEQTADDFNDKNKTVKAKPLFHTPPRTFIADPLPKSNKQLKIASNPEFAGEFAGEGAAGGEAKENFGVAKVWIEDGCIVCDACETAYPEVFEVKDDGAVVLSGHPMDNGLLVEEAADACPVEIIKFDKA